MRTQFLASPWSARIQSVARYALLAAACTFLVSPVTMIEYVVAVTLLPALFVAIFMADRAWGQRFSGSKLMWIVKYLILLAVFFIGLAVIEHFRPYLSPHFS
ncbi:hypothetical protein [Marinobacter nauticus]|nr:hypothetical protein [Marinobacter nauticus]